MSEIEEYLKKELAAKDEILSRFRDDGIVREVSQCKTHDSDLRCYICDIVEQAINDYRKRVKEGV